MRIDLNIPESKSLTFALHVVQRLRDAGHEAVWAGGCVRDALMGNAPKDYDVATSASPDEIVTLFGPRKTVTVGAAFGVIMVLGRRKNEDPVEVATFRSDGDYSDGRRPDSVTFCSAEEDAQRRDFTINAMFYDPIERQVIDYVGGREDLAHRIVRAVGNPSRRIKEDKLRMLRAVRFSARFGFAVDDLTFAAIREYANELNQVSVERIAQELRRMLAHSSRAHAVDLLIDTGLLSVVFPTLSEKGILTAGRILPHLSIETFEPTLAALLVEQVDESASRERDRGLKVHTECRRLKLSGAETSAIAWLAGAFATIRRPSTVPLHELKPLLADARSGLFLDLFEAAAAAGIRDSSEATFLRSYLRDTARNDLNPAPLISGEDLLKLGITRGPAFSRILSQIRREQLDEIIHDREGALARVAAMRGESR